MADYWRRSARLLAAIAFPSLLGLLIVAPDFVALALGNEWERAVPVIQLLAIVGLLQALQFLNPDRPSGARPNHDALSLVARLVCGRSVAFPSDSTGASSASRRRSRSPRR